MTRDLRIDGLKFLMIFCVVLGHLDFGDYGLKINRVIYAFHMPVFVFLSGYLTTLHSPKERQRQWIKQTLVIYAFAQLASVVIRSLLVFVPDMSAHAESDDVGLAKWSDLISPGLALWYLVCLMYWRVSVWTFFQKTDDVKLLSLSVLFALLSGLIPLDNELAFQRTFVFFPFFVLGIVFKKRNWLCRLDQIPVIYAVIGLIVGFAVARGLPTFMPKTHYEDWHQLVFRVVQSGLGLVLCLLIVRISRARFVKSFARWGKYTLWIYIGHTYLILIGREWFPYLGISLNLFSALILAAVYCLVFAWMGMKKRGASGR